VAPAPAKKTKPVAMVVIPESAVVVRDGVELPKVACSKGGSALKTACWNLEVEEGKPEEIQIKADGFETEPRTLDGSDPVMMITLKQKRPGFRPPVVVPRGGGAKQGGNKQGGGDVITPKGYN